MIEYNIKINLQGEREIYENLVFTTGDKKGYRLNLAFYSNGKLFDVSNCALTVKARRADGAVIIDSGVCGTAGAYYDVADNAIAAEGDLELETALVRSDGTYATVQVIHAYVRRGFGESGLTSEDNEPVLAKLEAQAIDVQAKVNAAAKELSAHMSDREAHSEIFKTLRESVGTKADKADTYTKNEVDAYVKEAANGLRAETLELLWENASPTSEFAAQTITLKSSVGAGERVRIYYGAVPSVLPYPEVTGMAEFIIFDATIEMAAYIKSPCSTTLRQRRLAVKDDAVVIADCEQYLYSDGVQTTNNAQCIPLAIYKVKEATVI